MLARVLAKRLRSRRILKTIRKINRGKRINERDLRLLLRNILEDNNSEARKLFLELSSKKNFGRINDTLLFLLVDFLKDKKLFTKKSARTIIKALRNQISFVLSEQYVFYFLLYQGFSEEASKRILDFFFKKRMPDDKEIKQFRLALRSNFF